MFASVKAMCRYNFVHTFPQKLLIRTEILLCKPEHHASDINVAENIGKPFTVRFSIL